MLDIWIAVGIAFLTFAMGFMGIFVTLHPPGSSAEKWAWKIAFGIFAFSGCGLVVWQTQRYVQEQNGLNASIQSLGGQLNKSETDRKTDDAYLRAKLEDYKSLQELAPALLRLGQATEGFTQKQYEVQRLSDTQLLAFTHSIVAKIRGIASKCNATEQSIESKFEEEAPFGRVTTKERSEELGRQARQMISQQEATRVNCASEYRAEVMSDASYARQQLRARLGPDGVQAAKKMWSGSHFLVFADDEAIDGIFAGADPIDDSASYLEALANELAARKGLKW